MEVSLMTLDKFNYLEILCEERNVTKAAKRLFITQPTLTVFLNTLERNLGFKLFDRTKNPIALTKSGKLYMEQIRKLLYEEDKLVETIRQMEQEKKTISIGIGQIHSEMWCPTFVQQLLQQKPDLNIIFRESQEERLLEFLRNDEVDLILGHLQIDTVNFHFETLYEEQLVIAIPQNLIPAEMRKEFQNYSTDVGFKQAPILITPELLANLPLIKPTKTQGLYLNLKRMMELYHVPTTQIIQTANMITAASMVQLGLGYMYISPKLFQLTHIKNPQPVYYCTLPQLARTRKYYIGYKLENPNQNTISLIKRLFKTIITEDNEC